VLIMRMRSRSPATIPILVFLVLLVLPVARVAHAEEVMNRAQNCLDVLQDFLKIPEKGISSSLLANAQGVAIIPDVVKLAFVIGGRTGKGVLLVREADGSWSLPVFIELKGGSVGWQIGAQSTDVILVFKTRQSVNGLLNGQFTLGADASIAAGPIGRQAGAATNVQLKAEIYSYARSRGVFAGISLDGSQLKVDDDADAAFYEAQAISPDLIVVGDVPEEPPIANQIVDLLAAHTPNSP
jgi:lipid-binding SYLF domain-containing protein